MTDYCKEHLSLVSKIERCETDIGILFKALDKISTRTAIFIGIGTGATFMIGIINLFILLNR